MERVILLDFDSTVLHPEAAAKDWIRSVDIRGKLRFQPSGGSLMVAGSQRLITRLVRKLDAQEGPEQLVSALVPSGVGNARRIRGGSYAAHMRRLTKSKGRTTRLNALPTELGEEYWHSMTHPDYARED